MPLGEIGAISHKMFCQRVGHLFNADPADIEKISEAYLRGPYDGAEKLLADLKDADVKVACLTNTNDHHWSLMTDPNNPASALLALADFRIASHLAGLRKPDEKIFGHVEQVCGAEAGSILFFDDILDNIAAAETSGWQAMQVVERMDPVGLVRRELVARGVLKA